MEFVVSKDTHMKDFIEFVGIMLVAMGIILLGAAAVIAVFALRVLCWALLVGALGWLFSFLVDDALIRLGLTITPMQLGALIGIASLVTNPIHVNMTSDAKK